MTVQKEFEVQLNEGKVIGRKFLTADADFSHKPAVILLHDALGSTAQWKNIPDLIAMSLQLEVYSFDRLNYGKSEFIGNNRETNYLEIEGEKRLPEFIQKALPNRKLILVGHSDGGSIALIYAGCFPKSVLALVAIAPHIVVESITIKGIKEALVNRQKLYTGLLKYHHDKTEYLLSGWSTTWQAMFDHHWNLNDYIKRITAPALLIQGELDEYATLNQLEQITALSLGTTTQLVYPALKHFPHLEQKGMVINDIVQYLRQHLP